MASSTDGQIQDINLNGFVKARVIKNVDATGEGRLGLFIPSIITEVPHGSEAATPKANTVKQNLFANGPELQVAVQTHGDNYIWVRPCAALVEGGSSSKNTSGSYKVPKVGTMVNMYFEGGDPNRPYWMPFTPSINGDVIAGTNLGKGTNMANSGSNWKDMAKRVNIHVIAEYDNTNIIYVDNNDNANAVVIHVGGHTISAGSASESGVIVETAKGHRIHLDENSKQIRLKTHSGGAKLTLGDDGNISLEGSSSIKLKAPRIDLN